MTNALQQRAGAIPRDDHRLSIGLLDGFRLTAGTAYLSVPHSAQRVLAFLAITRSPVARSRVAGMLWPEVSERRALGNLRTALWRLGRVNRNAVDVMDERLRLDDRVRVDFDELLGLCENLIAGPGDTSLRQVPRLAAAGELLPDWDEEWLIVERERFHELRIRALECASACLLGRGDHGAALAPALAAVAAEPLREGSQRALVAVHLADGNVSSALRTYEAYRRLIWSELRLRVPVTVQEFVTAP